MPNFDYQAILFDLDGVLIDADLIYQRHWKNWAEQHRVSFERILEVHHGRPAIRTMEIVAPHLDAATESTRFNQELEDDTDMTGTIAYPGVAAARQALPSERWAIATSAPRGIARPRLEFLGLPSPSVLVTPEDVQRGKPAPDPYLAAAKGLGFDPADCLVIEDSPAGIEAARAAGANVFAIASTHEHSELANADAICAQFSDLIFEATDADFSVSVTIP